MLTRDCPGVSSQIGQLNRGKMKRLILLFSRWLAFSVAAAATAASKEARFFELRIYYAAPGKLDAMNARFRDHALRLFERHGMTNIGYWMPLANTEGDLIYLLAYPGREAREKSWKEFYADPEWQAAFKESEKDGQLVAKYESIYLTAADFSSEVRPLFAQPARTFELRVYKCTPNNLPNLLTRFRDHTVALFAKHGMTQIGYWIPADKDKGADDTMIYVLAHNSKEAAAESFKNFRTDPEWVTAQKLSEDRAGGSLTAPDGVKSTFMVPTDYSPMK